MSERERASIAPETPAFLGLGAAAWIWLQLDADAVTGNALVLLLAAAVAVAGLPHGALDPWVAHRAGIWRKPAGCAAFHSVYVALAAAVVLIWLAAPGPALVAFLALSAWHFSGDWRAHLPVGARAIAGAALLALPAWAWPDEVAVAFSALAGADGTLTARALAGLGPWLAAGLAAAALLALRRSARTALELTAVGALAVLLPPLVFFIVYFCVLHSPRHLRRAFSAESRPTRRRMAAVATLYTLLALGGAATAWPWLAGPGPQSFDAALLRLVFIGLAALTLPHMLVVMRAEHVETAR